MLSTSEVKKKILFKLHPYIHTNKLQIEKGKRKQKKKKNKIKNSMELVYSGLILNVEIYYKGLGCTFCCLAWRLLKNINTGLSLLMSCRISSLHDQVGEFSARIELRQTRRVPPSCRSTCIFFFTITSR